MKNMKWIVTAILCLALALQAGAQEKPERHWVTVTIESVDEDGMGFTTHYKDLGEMKCRLTPKCKSFHLYMTGNKDDLKDGTWVKVYGNVSDDGLTVDNASSAVTLTYKSKRYIKSRLDGQVKWQGDNLYVESQKGPAKINASKKGLKVTVSAAATKEEIKPGVKATFGAIKEGDTWNLVDEMRFYVPRRDKKE